MNRYRTLDKMAIKGGKPAIFLDKKTHSIGPKEIKAVNKVLKSGELSGFSASSNKEFFGGPEVINLEKSFKKIFKTKYAVAFNSATSAIYAAIMSLKLEPGDEIITTPYTMPATATSILQANCIPVFADISLDDFNLDPKSVKQRITKKTKAIILVNLFGQSGRSKELKKIANKHNLKLIEDNSQSPGAMTPHGPAGTIGDMGIFSFNRHKTVQSGEGGVLITNSKSLSYYTCLVRNHGESVARAWKIKDLRNIIGQNLRMTEMEATVANEQIKRLKELNKVKALRVKWIKKELSGFDFLKFPENKSGYTHVNYFLPIIYDENKINISRKKFCKIVSKEGFTMRSGYREPLYNEPVFKKKICFGKNNWPFKINGKMTKVKYDKRLFPNTELIQNKRLIIINELNHNINKKHILKLKQIVNEIFQYRKKI